MQDNISFSSSARALHCIWAGYRKEQRHLGATPAVSAQSAPNLSAIAPRTHAPSHDYAGWLRTRPATEYSYGPTSHSAALCSSGFPRAANRSPWPCSRGRNRCGQRGNGSARRPGLAHRSHRGRRFRRATARQVRLARADGGPSGAVSLPVFPLASLLALADLLVARVALLAGGKW